MLAWSDSIQDAAASRQKFEYEPGLALFRLYQMLADLRERLMRHSADDPLDGLWHQIDRGIKYAVDGPLRELIGVTAQILEGVKPADARWALTLQMFLDPKSVPPSAGSSGDSELGSLGAGQDTRPLGTGAFDDFIATRAGKHRPLILVGQIGSGRQTLARYYAMAMVCDAPTRVPCFDECDRCRSILSNSSWDYLPFDAQRTSGGSIEEQLVERLDKSKTSHRDKHVTIALRNAVHISHLFSRYLKTLESELRNETWIFCIETLDGINPALISRSDVWHVKPLARGDAIELVARPFGKEPPDPQAMELIVREGKGMPLVLEQMALLCQRSHALSVDDVRRMLRLDWGEALLQFCETLVEDESPSKQSFGGILSIVTMERLKLVLVEIRLALLGSKPNHSAFLYLDGPVAQLAKLIQFRADLRETPWQQVWIQLQDAWTANILLDDVGLADLVRRSRRILAAPA